MADEKFIFDFNKVTYREIKDIDLDEEEKVRGLIAKVLVRWPYDEAPTADRIDEMGLQDFADMQAAFNERLEGMFRRVAKPE